MTWYVGKFNAGEHTRRSLPPADLCTFCFICQESVCIFQAPTQISSPQCGLSITPTSHSLVTLACFIFFILHIRSQQTFSTKGQTTVCGPNPACPTFLYGLMKNGFYIFKWLKKKKRQYFVMWENYMKLKFQCPKFKQNTDKLVYTACGCFCTETTELNS